YCIMKRFIVFITVFLCFGVISSLNAQVTSNEQASAHPVKKAPSDQATGYTYDFELAQSLIVNCQIEPDSENQIALPITKQASFPKLKSKANLNDSYLENLKSWMEKNPDIIISTLKSREDIVHKF
ncbi:MAG: hypothetical protein AB7O73_07240, partial [Bacteroidia bacterium]